MTKKLYFSTTATGLLLALLVVQGGCANKTAEKIETSVSRIPASLTNRTLKLKGSKSTLSIEAPAGFKLHKDFLGLPFALIEQNSAGKKSSISIIPTGVENVRSKEELLRQNYGEYKEGRRRYAKKRGLSNLKFLSPLFLSNSSKAKIISSGYQYTKKDGTKNVERSFFLICPKEAFLFKLLTENNTKGEALLADFQSRLEESRCEI